MTWVGYEVTKVRGGRGTQSQKHPLNPPTHVTKENNLMFWSFRCHNWTHSQNSETSEVQWLSGLSKFWTTFFLPSPANILKFGSQIKVLSLKVDLNRDFTLAGEVFIKL